METLNDVGGERVSGVENFRQWFWDWSFFLPFVWVMFSASRGLGVFETQAALDAVETDPLQGSPEGFVYLTLVLGGIVLLARNRFNWKEFLAEHPVLVGLYVVTLLSVLWSDVPSLTLKRFMKTFGVLIMVSLFLLDAGEKKVIRFLAFFVGVYLLWSLAYIVFIPSLGRGMTSFGEQQLIGIAYTKNSLAQVALAGCLVYGYQVFLDERKKVISFVFLVLCFGSIIVADSITCLLLGILSILGFLMYRGVRRSGLEFRSLVLLLSMLFASLVVFFLMFHEGDGALSKVLSGFGRDVSLTGRVDLWKDVLAVANENWLLGKGYGAFWLEGMDNQLWDIYVWQPNQAHQGFIDIYLQLGVVGLGLSLLWVGRVLGTLIRSSVSDSFDAFRLLFIVVLLIHNMVESSLFRLNHINWFLFLLLALSFSGRSAEFRAQDSFTSAADEQAESAKMKE